ncbi:MAG: ATP-binding protein [Bacteroidales bacterium]|nr:ATP-binding protein [Bacteroidales bacterium]
MNIKRKIISYLEQWKKKQQKEALLICGARQVGKTTIVREFARQQYKHFVEINFEQTPEAKHAFDGNRDANSIISRLSIMGYGPFVEKQTLVFFDEVQSCPNARTAIKFLVEDGRFDYIESGSLLGINYAEVSSYPVGFERQIRMYPLDFEEWLWANGVSEQVTEQIRNNYNNLVPVDDFLHEQLMKHYRTFLIVGGMPKVVATYLENPDFAETTNQQKIIIDSYRLDIAKYAAAQKTRAKRFFDAIPSQLAKEKKRFVLSDLEKTASMQKYEDAAQWLSDAGVAIFCYNTHSLELPFEQYENRNLFKVYLLDTGLLCNMWADNVQWQVLQGDLSINEGALTENYVAAELVKHGHQLHYYDHKSRNELDFLLQEGKRMSILEVKSGKDYKRHSSLTNALMDNSNKIGRCLVLNKYNVEQTENVTYLPLYMAAFV